MRIVHKDGSSALAEASGVTRKVRLDLLPDTALGDYVLVHAGLAIARVDAEEAEATLALVRELGQ